MIFVLACLCILSFPSEALNSNGSTTSSDDTVGLVVTKDQRKSLVVTEYGEISVIDNIEDGTGGPYHIQFLTLEPNSLFLPVLLHADMVLYVHTGSGKLTWVEEKHLKTVSLKRGDIFRLKPDSVFYLESEREKLRVNAIFANSDEDDVSPV
ncbi:hypothetical protein FNV43_RR17326 [Rhamnella rubrinervis]|uniref:Vicilin n=1 Tax=Rhamnella rubrinervis TaxID=2594499 RepID=A0A8K0E2D4_9ROSA|nr:hypothetical protein FNV43_RR17326 [Rhamnella rubrinervis]